MKDFKARVARIFSSRFLDDWRTFISASSRDFRAISLSPVSGRVKSMCVSHVARTRQDFVIFKELLFRHSSKA
jgi:hypothetical protein